MTRLLGAVFGLTLLLFCLGPAFAEPPAEQDAAGYRIPPEGVWLPAGLELPRVGDIPEPVCLVCDDDEGDEEHEDRKEPPAARQQPSDEAGQ